MNTSNPKQPAINECFKWVVPYDNDSEEPLHKKWLFWENMLYTIWDLEVLIN